MTLQDCIDRYHAAPQAIASHAVLSDLGHAVAAAYRLRAALRQLGPDDLAVVMDLLAAEILQDRAAELDDA